MLSLWTTGFTFAQAIIARAHFDPIVIENPEGVVDNGRIAHIELLQLSNDIFQFVFTYNDGMPADTFTLTDPTGPDTQGINTYRTVTLSDGKNTHEGFYAKLAAKSGLLGLDIFRTIDNEAVLSAVLSEY
jgi:hypothetical protein